MRVPLCGWFVTGTDTGVGKTVVAAALAAALRRRGVDAGVMKPVETGCARSGGGVVAADARFLATVAGVEDPPHLVCPVRLEAPLAPSAAAAAAGVRVDPALLIAAARELARRRAALVVEGAGGLLVPIHGRYLMADLARELGLPLVVVARPGLGTINHTLLTVRCARQAGLEVAAVLLNNYPVDAGSAERSSAEALRQLVEGTPVGLLPHDPGVDPEGSRIGSMMETIAQSEWFAAMVRSLAGAEAGAP